MNKKLFKISTLLLLSSNVLYSNSLLIDLNFGTSENIKSYKSNLPNRYTDISNLKSTNLYFSDFTSQLSSLQKNFVRITPSNGYLSDNHRRFINWLNNDRRSTDWVEGDRLSTVRKNVAILTNNITSNKSSEIKSTQYDYLFFNTIQNTEVTADTLNSIYDRTNEDYNSYLNFDYCSNTRYENADFHINQIEVKDNGKYKIPKITPNLIIKHKIVNNNIGQRFSKSYLSINSFIEFFLNSEKTSINSDFSNLLSSVSIRRWKYERLLYSNATEALQRQTEFNDVIKLLNEVIKINVDERNFLVDTIKTIRDIELSYYNTLKDTRLYKGNDVCLNYDYDNNIILNQLKNITTPSINQLKEYNNNYGVEKTIFNYKKESLKMVVNTYKDSQTITVPIPNNITNGSPLLPQLSQDDGMVYFDNKNVYGNEYTDITFSRVLKWIDTSNINFSTEGFLVSKSIVFRNDGTNKVSVLTDNTYSIPNINTQNNEETEDVEDLSTSEIIDITQEESDTEIETELTKEKEELQEERSSVGPLNSVSIEVINSLYSKSYDSEVKTELDGKDDVLPTSEEWEKVTDLMLLAVSIENGKNSVKKEIVKEEISELEGLKGEILEENIELEEEQESYASLLDKSNTTEENLAIFNAVDEIEVLIEENNNQISNVSEEVVSLNNVSEQLKDLNEEEQLDYLQNNLMELSKELDVTKDSSFYVEQYFNEGGE